MMSVVALCVLSACLSTGLVFSIRKNLELIDRFEELSEVLMTVTSDLREHHDRLEEKLKMEVFYDDPVVKEVVREMSGAKNSVAAAMETISDIVVMDAQDEEAV